MQLMLNIENLPSLSIDNLKQLPELLGVYFIISNDGLQFKGALEVSSS